MGVNDNVSSNVHRKFKRCLIFMFLSSEALTGGGSSSSGALRQHKKQRRKSRSGSSSPSDSSRSGSTSSSRSGSSGGSTSGGSTSPGSSPHRASNVAVTEDRRPLAICVKNLPTRSSDTSLKDGLFHEYKKHGKVTWVKVVGAAGDRYALVCFKKPEDVEKALEVSHDKLFFGCKIEVAPYQGYDVEDNEFRPYEAELDEYHPKATRTLFIGNLEKDVTASELRKHFEPFGEIIVSRYEIPSNFKLGGNCINSRDRISIILIQVLECIDSRLPLSIGN